MKDDKILVSSVSRRSFKIRNKTLWIGALFIFGFFAFLSITYVFINSYFLVSGADFDFHTSRLIGLANSLKNNNWFPKINYYMANGLGYGTPMFYGEWFLYLPAILISIFNFSVLQAWLILYVCFYTLSLSILFYTAKKFELSNFRSILFSILILFNPLMATIINGALAFAICLVLLPIILYYLYRLFYFQESNIVRVAILATIVINTHILSTMIIVLICLLFTFLNLKKMDVKIIMSLIQSVIITIGLSAFFLFPMLEQKLSQEFIAFNTSNAFRFTSVKGIGTIIMNSLNENTRTISNFPTISLVGLLLLLVNFAKLKFKGGLQRDLLFLILVLFILGSNIFPWISFASTTLGIVQFVGRYLVFALILIMLLSVLNKDISNYLLTICIVINVILGVSRNTLPDFSMSDNVQRGVDEYFDQSYDQKKLRRYEEINDMRSGVNGESVILGVSGGEYLNVATKPDSLSKNMKPIIKNGHILSTSRSYGKMSISFDVDEKEDTSEIIVPFLWYKGYVASYENGSEGSQPQLLKEKDTEKTLKNGQISLLVKKGGSVDVYYVGTFIQRVSACISIITLLMIFVLINRRKIGDRSIC